MDFFPVASVAAVGVYALGSGALVSTSDAWYNSIKKPSWQPPSQYFGLIWSYNYLVLIGAGLAIGTAAPLRIKVQWLVFLCLSVVAALLWANLFFGERHDMQTAAWALATAAVLTLPLVRLSFQYSSWPWGVLMVPYQAWLVLATILAFSYAKLKTAK